MKRNIGWIQQKEWLAKKRAGKKQRPDTVITAERVARCGVSWKETETGYSINNSRVLRAGKIHLIQLKQWPGFGQAGKKRRLDTDME